MWRGDYLFWFGRWGTRPQNFPHSGPVSRRPEMCWNKAFEMWECHITIIDKPLRIKRHPAGERGDLAPAFGALLQPISMLHTGFCIQRGCVYMNMEMLIIVRGISR